MPTAIRRLSCKYQATILGVVLAMMTSARNSTWPRNTESQDLDAAGLLAISIVRMKLFTLDERLINPQAGHMGCDDQSRVTRPPRTLMPPLPR